MYQGPGRTASARPSRASQIRVIESPQVVATNAPSGLKAIAVTSSLWPLRCSSCFALRGQITTSRPSTPASASPSGLKASAGKKPLVRPKRNAGGISVSGHELGWSPETLERKPPAIRAECEVEGIRPVEAPLQGAGGGVVQVDAPVAPSHRQPSTFPIEPQFQRHGRGTIDRMPGRRPARGLEELDPLTRAEEHELAVGQELDDPDSSLAFPGYPPEPPRRFPRGDVPEVEVPGVRGRHQRPGVGAEIEGIGGVSGQLEAGDLVHPELADGGHGLAADLDEITARAWA